MDRPVGIRNPHFYTPDELQDSLFLLLREVPATFYGVYLSSTGDGLKWITHRPGNFTNQFPVAEMRRDLPNASDHQLHSMSGYREAILCLSGLGKLWRHWPADTIVDSTGQRVPDDNKYVFDPVQLVNYNYDHLRSYNDVMNFICGLPRVRIENFPVQFTIRDMDFQYANAMYAARDNINQSLRLDQDSGIDEA